VVPPVETGSHSFGETVEDSKPASPARPSEVARSSSPRAKSHVTRSKTVSLQDWHQVHFADFGLVATEILASGEFPLARGTTRR
jgi:hypothetical protein